MLAGITIYQARSVHGEYRRIAQSYRALRLPAGIHQAIHSDRRVALAGFGLAYGLTGILSVWDAACTRRREEEILKSEDQDEAGSGGAEA